MTKAPILSARDRADALIKADRHVEVIELCRNLVEMHPEEESHLLALAWALHDSGQRAEALDCFEHLFQKELVRKVFTGFAFDELVRIYRSGKDWEKLISVCERAGAAQPEDVGLLQTLGEAYLAADHAADAERVFEKLTVLEPEVAGYWCSLGNARLAVGDPGRAEAAYLRAAEIDPADAPVFFSRLADACLRAGFPEQAQAAWTRCLTLKPDEPLYLLGLGDVLSLRGEPDAAVEAYDRAASINPPAAGSFWHRLGELLTQKGLHPRAAEAFEKAVKAEPENPRYLLRLASAYAACGLADPAAAVLRRVESLTGIISR